MLRLVLNRILSIESIPSQIYFANFKLLICFFFCKGLKQTARKGGVILHKYFMLYLFFYLLTFIKTYAIGTKYHSY